MSVNTPRFSGPFKWSALRQQLLSLRDDIHTIRKVAGRNVTIDEHRGKGKVINVRRDRAQTTPSVCGGCALPGGDCPHAFCLEFTLDADDTSNRDLIEINGSSGNQIGFYYDQAGNWQLYAAGTVAQLVIPTSDPHGTWHSARIEITRVDDDNVHIVLTVDGNSDNGDFAWTAGDDVANIRVGAIQGDSNPVHRTFRCVAALGNPDNSETDFFFPASSFDSLTAGASIDGSGFLRIDHGAVAVDDYGEKAVSFALTCPTTSTPDNCPNPSEICVTFSGITICTDCLDGSVGTTFKAIDVSVNGSFTLAKTVDTGDFVQWEGDGGVLRKQNYTDVVCGTEGTNCDATAYIVVICDEFGFSATSGTLAIGSKYKIYSYNAGDDFTNVGAASNTTGEIFTATGTTPADWSHGSAIVASIHTVLYQVPGGDSCFGGKYIFTLGATALTAPNGVLQFGMTENNDLVDCVEWVITHTQPGYNGTVTFSTGSC